MEQIIKYFPQLSDVQRSQYAALMELYRDWNAKINVISRKDIDNLYEHHVLHSLAIAKFTGFQPGTEILDFGTGGGFPGIPLAIMFPECRFKLIDGTGKKILVATEVAKAIGDVLPPVHEPNYKGHYCILVLHAEKPGYLREVSIADSFRGELIEKEIRVDFGSKVEAFSGANNAIGSLFLRFNTREEMDFALTHQQDWLTISIES